ncbi:hypothetical protein QQ045_018363 [Rhodiola kirilowii]
MDESEQHLFCDGEDIVEVKKHVEHSLRDLSIFGAEFMDIDESDGQIESDELLTAIESSDDESTPQNKYPHFNEMEGFSKQIELEKGMQFRNKHIFNKALRYYAVLKGFDFYYVMNGKTKVLAHCKTVHCPWRVLASWFSDGKGGRSFMIKTWIPHKDKSCPREFENSKVSVEILMEYYLEDFRNNPKWEAPAFFKHVKADLEAVCEAESKETWTWFLQALINDIGFPTQHNWCFIPDQQKGLQEALKDIIPEGEHMSCVRHIYANFKKKFKGKELKDAMWATARATTKGQFNGKMKVLKDLDVASHLHMTTFDPKSWSMLLSFSQRVMRYAVISPSASIHTSKMHENALSLLVWKLSDYF